MDPIERAVSERLGALQDEKRWRAASVFLNADAPALRPSRRRWFAWAVPAVVLAAAVAALAAFTLGGVLTLGGKPGPVLSGYTGDQRFFLSFGQVWRTKMRDSAIRTQTLSNEHTVAEFRVIGPTRNQDAWYDAFDVKPGETYYLPPAERVHLW